VTDGRKDGQTERRTDRETDGIAMACAIATVAREKKIDCPVISGCDIRRLRIEAGVPNVGFRPGDT